MASRAHRESSKVQAMRRLLPANRKSRHGVSWGNSAKKPTSSHRLLAAAINGQGEKSPQPKPIRRIDSRSATASRDLGARRPFREIHCAPALPRSTSPKVAKADNRGRNHFRKLRASPNHTTRSSRGRTQSMNRRSFHQGIIEELAPMSRFPNKNR